MSSRRQIQAERAMRFAEAHRSGSIVVLPNAFDVATARLIARRSPIAIGTTSAGIAAIAGFPDGERISREEMLAAAARIIGAVDIGVTVDVEAGYGDTIQDAIETARYTIEIGAIGLNIEDRGSSDGDHAGRLLPLDQAAAKIGAIRQVADDAHIALVINARTDTFLEDGDQVAEAIERGNTYLAAGADCVFTPGIADRESIQRTVAGLNGPLNVYAGATTPRVAELESLGVRRISVGCGPYQACLALVDKATKELLEQGSYDAFTAEQLSVGEIAELLDR